ncbi:unnamed protein product [Tilletia controversa]|nr:unnamed protein product [Tilletia caries]CAD6979722.1 unnamed protein product [Tilletia controversa]
MVSGNRPKSGEKPVYRRTGKRRAKIGGGGAQWEYAQWTEVYVHILNVVASAPTDPVRLAHMAIQIMLRSRNR